MSSCGSRAAQVPPPEPPSWPREVRYRTRPTSMAARRCGRSSRRFGRSCEPEWIASSSSETANSTIGLGSRRSRNRSASRSTSAPERQAPRLLDLRLLLSGPGAGRVRERRAGLVVERGSRALEDRALQSRRRHDLRHRRVAVRRLRRLAVVDDPPGLLEQLLGDEAADEAAGDTEWDEQDL